MHQFINPKKRLQSMRNPLKGAAKKPTEGKTKSIAVGKIEVADGKVKFYVAKGMGKKHWVTVKEIDVEEIERIEAQGNSLSITRKGGTDDFFTKDNPDAFTKLNQEVNMGLETKKQISEVSRRAALRRTELLAVLNSSLGWVDASFDVLMALQKKRVNWLNMEAGVVGFGAPIDFKAQTLAPLDIDFSKVNSAIKRQSSKDSSKEAFSVLKTVYGYFDGLNASGEMADAKPSLESSRTLILAYFVLNDLLLGKLVGDSDNRKENAEFDRVLGKLTELGFNVDFEKLRSTVGGLEVEGNFAAVVDKCRGDFQEQVKAL